MRRPTSRKPRMIARFLIGRTWCCLVAGAATPACLFAQAIADSVPPAIVISALRSRVRISGLEPPEPTILQIQDADSLIAALGDPYAKLLTPPAYQRFRSASGVAYGGIGARISARKDTVWVANVFPGSPAESSGLRPLDRIVAINGRRTAGWSTGRAVEQLRGPIGTMLTLLVVRGGGREPIRLSVRRSRVRVPSIRAAMVDSTGVATVYLAKFGAGAAHKLRVTLDSLTRAGMTGLILDLRGNPGGLLSEALDVSRLFLNEERLIAEVRGRPHTPAIKFVDRTPEAYPGLPIVILIGPQTASASEIVAAALQDHDRAAILGTRSYGKGTVQQVFQLPQLWRIKLTTALWYRPSGESLERHLLQAGETRLGGRRGGIEPDLTVADSMRLTALGVVEGFSEHWPRVSTAMIGEVSRYLDSASTVGVNLKIPDSALDGMLDTLLAVGVVMPQRLDRDDIRHWLAQRLAHLVVSTRWGQAAGVRWRYRHDGQITTASALLRQASSPTALVASARWSNSDQVAQGTRTHAMAFSTHHSIGLLPD